MKQSPLLDFKSSLFVVQPGEDEATNPGIYGKSLAEWLRERLLETGTPAREVMAEDFGWLVPVASKPHSLYVACASTEEASGHWRVFVFAEGGLLARLMGKDRREASVAELYAAVRRVLEQEAGINGLREEAD